MQASTSDWVRSTSNQPDELKLKFLFQGVNEELCHSLVGGMAFLGRNEGLRMSTPFDSISDVHAKIHWDDKQRKWKAIDLKSSNGTKLRGKKLRSDRPTALKSSDELKLANGEVTIVVEIIPFEDTAVKGLEAFTRLYEVDADTASGEAEADRIGLKDRNWLPAFEEAEGILELAG